MKALTLTGYGGTDRLQVAEVPRPVPGDGEVLVPWQEHPSGSGL